MRPRAQPEADSSLVSIPLELLAEPARGDYRRYLGWTMALLPVPGDWHRARAILAPLGARAMAEPEAVSSRELLSAATDAYALSRRDVAPLLAWSQRA